jgi:PAS domain S-box-containing protein
MNKTAVHILLVEDSPGDAKLFAHIFSRSNKEGWQLVHVERLDDAIDFCQDFRFDVVLLDLGLPDSDGLETVAEFHAAEPDIPIVVLTGSDDEALALHVLAQGAQDYLVKDQINSQLLMRAIRYAMERGQILTQLKDSERRFRGIFDQTFQFMGLLSPTGVILEINQTALDFIGAKQEAVIGLLLWETTAWNYSHESQEWLKTAIADAADGEFVRYEVEMCGAGDRKLWIDFSLKPLEDERGNVVMLIAEGRDISDRKRAEAEILKNLAKERELNQLKSNFISMVSHEFRNPMSVISGLVGLIQHYNHTLSEEKRSKYFERIIGAIKNMVQLLDEVLLLSKNESGKLQYKPAPIDLKNFCQNLTDNLQFGLKDQHQITFSCQGECSQVEMDAFLLEHMFTNLISNAIKYSPESGAVWFDLSCEKETATFRVIDKGMGIPLSDQQHLFETFRRGSNVDQIQGTGLGLSIVKNCVDLHQGKIKIESEVGVGTIVTVKLPLNPQRCVKEVEAESRLLNFPIN